MAISWWLQSCNNQGSDNPYTVVTVYGEKDHLAWENSNVAMFIGDQLRACYYVGLYMGFPTGTISPPGCTNELKHVITAWGDNGPNNTNPLASNPSQVKVTDSDRQLPLTAQTVDDYSYLAPGWFLDYMTDTSDPFLDNIVTLSKPDTTCGGPISAQHLITQTSAVPATGLSYKIRASASSRICQYSTTHNWPTLDVPRIVKHHTAQGCSTTECEYLEVEWQFGCGEVVPQNQTVTITTDLWVPAGATIEYSDVVFTYEPVPPCCIPAASTWGVVILALATLTAGTILTGRRGAKHRGSYTHPRN